MKLTLKILGLSLLFPLLLQGQTAMPNALNDTPREGLTVSFLTCQPGNQVHRLYGHTALRFVEANHPQVDWTYDYGWFSFQTPNFVLKFILGLTDYSMAKESTALFLSSHLADDMPIAEQKLSLTPQEAQTLHHIVDSAMTHTQVEVREYPVQGIGGRIDTLRLFTPDWNYRYSFLYDNCTTRALRAVERAIQAHGGQLVYPSLANDQTPITQREMIHQYTSHSPWYELGQDLLLGPEVDQKHTMAEMTKLNFLPVYAQNFFEEARVRRADGSLQPLVTASAPLFPHTPQPRTSALPFGPNVVFWSLFAIGLLLTAGQWRAQQQSPKHQRAWRIWTSTYDFAHLIGMGLVGILLTIMVGWSQHPAVGENWLLSIFNPLWLLLAAYHAVMLRKGLRSWWPLVLVCGVGIYLMVYIAGYQRFPAATLPLALTLLVRAVAIIRLAQPRS